MKDRTKYSNFGFAVFELLAILTVFAMMTYALFATEPNPIPAPSTVAPTVTSEQSPLLNP